MVRIELLGPSGVGKTTVLKAAVEAREGRPWFAPSEAETLIESRPKVSQLKQAIDAPQLREFINHCVRAVAATDMAPSRRLAALTMLRKACFDHQEIAALDLARPILHDELLLHRAFSLLPRSAVADADARAHFTSVPLPDAAVVVRAGAATIERRLQGRKRIPNVFADLEGRSLLETIERSLQIATVAVEVLRERGIPVLELDTTGDAAKSADRLATFIAECGPGGPQTGGIRDRLLTASGSFHKKTGRHELRTRDVIYCAFSIPGFTVTPEESQRDASKRIAHFGLTADSVAGRSVLDLGCNAGAMLLQLSNFEPASGLGIEYDVDKVQLATEIAQHAGVGNLRFEQGDIDALDAAELGVFDIVLALAIEGHVQQPDRLYALLGNVTGDLLCFEGNSTCDMTAVRERLSAGGFVDFVDLGFCDDDIDPRNNTRPQLLARKPRSAPWLSRLRAISRTM